MLTATAESGSLGLSVDFVKLGIEGREKCLAVTMPDLMQRPVTRLDLLSQGILVKGQHPVALFHKAERRAHNVCCIIVPAAGKLDLDKLFGVSAKFKIDRHTHLVSPPIIFVVRVQFNNFFRNPSFGAPENRLLKSVILLDTKKDAAFLGRGVFTQV